MNENHTPSLRNLIRAIDFAAKKHSTQRRKNAAKTPYINHPIGVMNLLSDLGRIEDYHILSAAVLHDTVEDTDTSTEEIKKLFGSEVQEMVAQVTDDKSLPKAQRKQLQIEHAPHMSYGGKLVKLADKLYNITDLCKKDNQPVEFSLERTQEYFKWAQKVVAGLRGTNEFLENALDVVFNGTFVYRDVKYPTISSV